jgi:hypothetical protein
VALVNGGNLAEVHIPVPDRSGVLVEVTTLTTQLGTNIFDLEIRSSETGRGTLVLMVSAPSASTLVESLLGLGYHPSLHPLPDS